MMRSLALMLLCCSQLLWAEAEAEKRWSFKVLINDREVGSHQFVVVEQGELLSVTSTMALDFKVLLIKRVTYQHQATETWDAGCLTGASSEASRQGKKLRLQAGSLGSGLSVQSEQGSALIEGCVRSFAYWDPKLLQGENLLNIETGEYLPVVISSRISAEDSTTHMTIALPKGDIHLQYDAAGDWLSLQIKLKTGAELKYQRI
jgi:hypothetical protein